MLTYNPVPVILSSLKKEHCLTTRASLIASISVKNENKASKAIVLHKCTSIISQGIHRLLPEI